MAERADEARRALVALAAAAAKVPRLNLKLLRSIELLDELAIRARVGATQAELGETADGLSKALSGGLQGPPRVLPDPDRPVTARALTLREIEVRRDLAARNGAKGGRRRTPAQQAAFAKAVAARRAKLAAKQNGLARGA